MKFILLLFISMLFPQYLFSQTNIVGAAGIKRIQPFNFIETDNHYYFLKLIENGLANNYIPAFKAAEYRLVKVDKQTNQVIAATHIYGDTLQADSVLEYYAQKMTYKAGKLHIAYQKAYIFGTSSVVYDTKYMQLDTNLNIIVAEKSLGPKPIGNMFIPYQNNFLLSYYASSGSTSISKYLVLNDAGNIIKDDTFEVRPLAPTVQLLAEVMSYNDTTYLVTGEYMVNPNILRTLYLADTNLHIIDTFLNKPYFYSGPGIQGYIPRFPNFVALPTGSLISAGMLSAGTVKSYIAKHERASRFNINKLVYYEHVDSNDLFDTPMPGIHNLEYNEFDNRIYFANSTHQGQGGGCTATYNYLQVMSVDTNLQTKWRKFIYFGPDSCGVVTTVSKPDNRPGVLVIAFGQKLSINDTAYRRDYAFYIDSSGSLSVSETKGLVIRDRIKTYPNPAYNRLYIDDIFGKLQEVSIYNMLGNLVTHQTLYGQKAEIDITSFSPGVYLVRVKTKDDEVYQSKILKQ